MNTAVFAVDKKTGELSQLNEINGVLYFFESTDEYTITASQDLSGKVKVYYKNKTINNHEIVSYDLPVERANVRFSEEDFQEITDIKYLQKLQPSDKIRFNYVQTRVSDTEAARRIDEVLCSEYGNPYSGKYLGKYTSSGYTAYLYGSEHFERYRQGVFELLTGWSIDMVSNVVDLPTNILEGIIYFAEIGNGVLGLINDLSVPQYKANVHYNKEVKVENEYPYRAGKSQYGECIIGDIGVAYFKGSLNQDYDYDDNISLMKKGINNYVNY